MKKFFHLTTGAVAFSIALFSVAAGCGSAGVAGAPAQSSGSPEPKGTISDFALRDVNGRTHSLSDYLGSHTIVLSFWATWCEPCKKELVRLQELYETHKGKGFVVLAISMDEPETQGEVRPFVRSRRLSFPVLLDSESLVTARFNPRRSAPYNLIIDKQQNIVWTHEGYVPGDEDKLETAVLEIMEKGKET